jgi:hypothetical protein
MATTFQAAEVTAELLDAVIRSPDSMITRGGFSTERSASEAAPVMAGPRPPSVRVLKVATVRRIWRRLRRVGRIRRRPPAATPPTARSRHAPYRAGNCSGARPGRQSARGGNGYGPSGNGGNVMGSSMTRSPQVTRT